MSTQAEIDLEARIAALEQQIAEMAAKINPLYAGGMDRYIHSGYMQFDGVPIRWDTKGQQIESNGVTRIGLRFLETLQADPTDIFPRSELRGSATSTDNSARISLRAVSSQANGNISYVHVIAADSASLAELVTSDTSVGTASMGVRSEDADDHPYSFANGGPFSLPPLSTDPTGSPLVDGMIWYNTTDDKLRARINGATKDLGGGGMSLIVKETTESVINSTTLQDDDELLFAVAANEVWQFEGVLIVDASSAPDIKLTFTGPSGAVGSYGCISQDTSNNTVVGAATLGSSTGIATAAQNKMIRYWGAIHNGANAGNLTLQWAQNTLDAGAQVYVRAGSYIKYQKET